MTEDVDAKHVVIIHLYTTPVCKHLEVEDSLLSSPPCFALGFPGAWE